MNYKISNLIEKVYYNFITGVYGEPKIPSKSEVMSKIESFTDLESNPIASYTKQDDIDINYIINNFNNIIDDINILYSSVETASKDILDQLTNSLKEHNGIKRELRLIDNSASDILNNNALEFNSYKFTESFNDSTNINTFKSDIIDYNAGIFTISDSSLNIVNMKHYDNKKLEFNVVENFSQLKEYLYIGDSNANIIFDNNNEKSITYKLITSSPTSLKIVTSIQLNPEKQKLDINKVQIEIDSDIAKGSIRLYYKDNYEWKDVKNNSIQEIKNNKVIFNFPSVNTDYIKLEFIKNSPDSFDGNIYYIVINNINIYYSTSKKYSTLISKPIIINSYDNEEVIISNINISGDVEIPNNTAAKFYISLDPKISGSFVDINGNIVNKNSSLIYKFDPTITGYLYLSDIQSVSNKLSGVVDFNNIEYNWNEIKLTNNTGNKIPKVLDFNVIKSNNSRVNSIFDSSVVKFSDDNYSGIYNVSGWVNTDNPNWNILESYVASGIMVSGVDVATLSGISWENIEDSSGNLNPVILASPLYSGQWVGYNRNVGYPFNYSNSNYTLKFNDYSSCINGWWRPYSFTVTPTGISYLFATGIYLKEEFNNNISDFKFNNIEYYKIYKFGYTDNIIDQSIKVYSYTEQPSVNNKVNSSFIWKYKSEFINRVGSLVDQYDLTNPSGWSNYYLVVPTGINSINEEFVVDGIFNLKLHNTNSVIDKSEYQILYNNNLIDKIYLKGLDNRNSLITSGVTFDYDFYYKVKNEYLSTWSSYIIVNSNISMPYVVIPNIISSDGRKIISKIVLTDIDNSSQQTFSDDTGGNYFINLQASSSTNRHYKIDLYCLSNPENGFCLDNWTPYIGTNNATISTSTGIKIVNRLDSFSLVSLSNLFYNPKEYKFAIYEESNEKYIVVKKPNKDKLPGYYFDSINKKYELITQNQLENKNHYTRQLFYSGVEKSFYTTGSDSDGNVYLQDMTTVNDLWNNGKVLNDYPNYTGYSNYLNYSTFNYPINMEDSNNQKRILYYGDIDPRASDNNNIVGSANWLTWLSNNNKQDEINNYTNSSKLEITDYNRGNLFYNTSENLPAYYSIFYKYNIEENNRFLYKIELSSNDEGSVVPKIKSITFNINEVADA